MRLSISLFARAPLALAPLALAPLALGGCDSAADKPQAAAPSDPALAGPLADQIMVDPELAGQNRVNEAVAVTAATPLASPPDARGPEAAAAAKAEALKLAGGALQPLPPPAQGDATPLLRAAATAAQVAAAARAGNVDCAAAVQYSANWANALPEPLAVYPRGAVKEAAGADEGGCRLRVVHFSTPVPVEDVLSYYLTRVRKAGYSAELRRDGEEQALGGRKGGSAYVVSARAAEPGLTEVDLVVSGG